MTLSVSYHPVSYHPAATAELRADIAWYEERGLVILLVLFPRLIWSWGYSAVEVFS